MAVCGGVGVWRRWCAWVCPVPLFHSGGDLGDVGDVDCSWAGCQSLASALRVRCFAPSKALQQMLCYLPLPSPIQAHTCPHTYVNARTLQSKPLACMVGGGEVWEVRFDVDEPTAHRAASAVPSVLYCRLVLRCTAGVCCAVAWSGWACCVCAHVEWVVTQCCATPLKSWKECPENGKSVQETPAIPRDSFQGISPVWCYYFGDF